MTEFTINRFIIVQKEYIKIVKKELINQKKETHWIWFIFPQLQGLGYSYNSFYYGLKNIEETRAYYKNHYLKHNMKMLIKIIMSYEKDNLISVFGDLDNQKVLSCMTLFYLATNDKIFKNVINKYYNGCLDSKTMLLLNDKR